MIFGKYKFTIRLKDDAQLPFYKGSTFRGVLGHALKKVVCALRNQECPTCILRTNCTYALVFETGHSVKLPAGARISSAPHPMVLEPPLTPKHQLRTGETLTCTLLLFGEINRNLPYFIYAFDQMGKIGIGKKMAGQRSRFVLESVTSIGTEEMMVYTNEAQQIRLPQHPENLFYEESQSDSLPMPAQGENRKISMEIITPLRIIALNAPVARLPFTLIMSSIIRRVTSLLNVYGNGEPELDYSGMIEAAKNITTAESSLQWLDWQRYSSRQDKKMFMGGMIGDITYQGDFSPFLPMMAMAEKVHIGKNSAFGLGKIIFKS